MSAEMTLQLEKQRQQVDVDHFDLSVRELVRMAQDGELQTAPEYQRKFRWQDDDESRLVESVFLGLPVPAIYVATNQDGTWELVDGLQRVSTLVHYASEDLKGLALVEKTDFLELVQLERLSKFNGSSFKDLSTALRLHFLKRFIRVTALSDKSDIKVRFDLFARLNTGGIALSEQEVRACVFRGPFTNLLAELARTPEFEQLLKLQKKRLRDGTSEEQVLKFFAYSEERSRFKGAVKTFLNDFAKSKMNASTAELARLENTFTVAVKTLAKLVKGDFLRPGVHVTPLNQFEAVLIAVGDEIAAGNTSMTPTADWLQDKALVSFSTGGTNTPNMLQGRINRARELLRGSQAEL